MDSLLKPCSPPPCTLLLSALKREDGSFAPAHLLSDGRLERTGRNSNSSATQASTSADSIFAALTRSAAIVVVGDELLAGKVRVPCMPSAPLFPVPCTFEYHTSFARQN